MIKKTNIDLSISPKRKNPLTVGVQLSSYDRNFHEFEISFLEKELEGNDAVDILTVFEGSKRVSESSTEIRDGSAFFRFDTTLIDRDEEVTNYVYLKSGDSQAEIGTFRFDVKLSEIDKEAKVIAKAYDKNYESLIQDFEKELRDYLPKLETMNQEEGIRQDEEAVRRLAEADRVSSEDTRKTAESERVSNEEERKLNEAERISKDSERDSKIETVEGIVDDVSSKIDSKANKSMFLSPKYDLVYDSCVRDVDTPLDAYSVPMESGHYFENVEDRDSDTTLTYEPDGVLLARPSVRDDFSPVLIDGFDVDNPYFDIRAKNSRLANDVRLWFIKYKDKDNWVGIRLGGIYQETRVITSVEGIETAIAVEDTGGSAGERQADSATTYSLKAEIIGVHQNFTETRKALRVFKNEQWVFTVPIPTNTMDFPNRVGFSVGSQTEILNFKAGRSS